MTPTAMDPTEIGTHGTLRLVKRLDPSAIVAAFPIDDDAVSFGRDPACSVRLYYPSVSKVHARIVFRERKAFLEVLGTNGVLIDGCQVYPAPNQPLPKTIPLPNNSEIEIHKKRFVFTYPPKLTPAPLISTPSRPPTTAPNTGRTHTLRLSMIHSAQVFSPRPSADPAANLRVLQTPLRASPAKDARGQVDGPGTGGGLMERLWEAAGDRGGDGDGDGEEIVLVDGNHPRVVQEEKDLVILEDVPYSPQPQAQGPHQIQRQTKTLPQTSPPIHAQIRPPASLHKAVLIRSAHRAVMRAEAERFSDVEVVGVAGEERDKEEEDRDMEEEEEEEREVAAFAGAITDSEVEDEQDHSDHSDEDDQDEGEQEQKGEKGKPMWRKSWGNLVGYVRAGSAGRGDGDESAPLKSEEGDVEMEQAARSASDDDKEEEEVVELVERPATPLPAPSPKQQQHSRTYQRALALTQFATPQPAPRARIAFGKGRHSVGGAPGDGLVEEGAEEACGGARRVRVETKWKVADIVVSGGAEGRTGVREGGGTPVRGRVSEAERKAIQERRRSALTAPDTFFGGQAPGIGRVSATYAYAAGVSSPVGSPYRGAQTQTCQSPYQSPHPRTPGKPGAGEEEDTKALLERMKETVEGMKRRRSGVSTPGASGVGRISLAGVASDEMDVDGDGDGGGMEEVLVVPGTPRLDLEGVSAVARSPKIPARAPVAQPHASVTAPFAPAPELKTPRMDGLRELFMEERVLATPAFEGVGEMMRTPVGWGAGEGAEGAEGEEEGEVKKSRRRGRNIPASKPPPSSSSSTAARRKTPPAPAKARTRTPVTEGRSNFADDEATPAGGGLERVAEEEEEGGRKFGRRGRSKAATALRDSDAEEGGGGVEKRGKARLVRGGGKRVVDDIPEEFVEQSTSHKAQSEENEAVVVESTVPERKPTARKTKVAAKSKVVTATDDDEGSSSRPTRRTARVVDSGASASEDSQPAKPIRKTQTRAPKAATAAEPEQEPATKTATVRKGRAGAKSADDESATAPNGKRGTRAKQVYDVEEVDEEDPLDSIGKPASDEPVVPVAAKGRRGTRSRTTTAETAVEEEAATHGTGKKASTSKSTKTSAAKKAVAAAVIPELVGSADGVDKENTPSVGDEEPVKAKTVRARKGTKTAAITDDMDVDGEGIQTTKSRATRPTRARK